MDRKSVFIIAIVLPLVFISFSCSQKQKAEQSVSVTTGGSETQNTSPVISSVVATPSSVQTSGTATITCNATDADGDTLSYGWTTTGGTLQTSSGPQVSWTAPNTAGNYTISVLVTDGKNGQASANVTVSVTQPQGANQNPVIGSGPTASPSSVKTGQQSTISVSASDPDGDTLSYSWASTCGTISGTGTSITWTAPSTAGSCVVSVVVQDGRGGTAGKSVEITVSSSTISNFKFLRKWGQKGTCGTINGCGDTDLGIPYGIGIDKDGNIYVTNYYGVYENFVKKFTNPGNLLKIYGIKGACTSSGCYPYTTSDGGFTTPTDVAIDSAGNIFVAEWSSNNNRVQKLDQNGILLTKWGTGYGIGFSIVVDKNGDILVSSESANKIYKFQSNGVYITSIGSGWGSDSGYLKCGTCGIAVDNQNNIYVADPGNHRVQVFKSDGTFLLKWGSNGINPGQFNSPMGIALDSSDNVYVVDSGNNWIQVFKSDGTFITSFGSNGSSDGLFSNPEDIAVDSGGLVYVVDSGNNRIQVFQPQ